jgi:phosphoserine phosphatase RsbU/P
VILASNTHILFYSDGITEADNGTDEEYGAARLLRHFQKPGACVEGLIAEVKRFGAESDRMDDATAVLLRSR